MNNCMSELTGNPPQETKRNAACNLEHQIPTLLLLESSLLEIHKARELDRARRHRLYQRFHNLAPLACSELAVVATSRSCHTAIQDGDSSTNEQFMKRTVAREPTLKATLLNGVAEPSSEVEGQRRQTPTHIDTTKVNENEKVVATHRKTSDRDILAKAVQARMASKSKNNEKKKNREETFPLSLDRKSSPLTGSEGKAFAGTSDKKPFFVSASLRWTCDLCSKRNNGDKTKCEICGRNQGFRLPALVQTNSNFSAPKKQISVISSTKATPSTINSALSTTTTNGRINSSALGGPATASNNNSRETVKSYFLKHKVDFEMHARQALADDVSSTLSYIRSAHSNNAKQT